jgi:hypothetical protein
MLRVLTAQEAEIPLLSMFLFLFSYLFSPSEPPPPRPFQNLYFNTFLKSAIRYRSAKSKHFISFSDEKSKHLFTGSAVYFI